MSKYVTTISENYRVDREKEATDLIEEAKQDNRFTVLKSSTTYKFHKETKSKPEEEYWIVSITKQFNEVRDPNCFVTINYEIDNGCFPAPVSRKEEDEEEAPWAE